MTGDRSLAIADLTVVLEPTASNSCMKVSDLLPKDLTCIYKTRIATVTASGITLRNCNIYAS